MPGTSESQGSVLSKSKALLSWNLESSKMRQTTHKGKQIYNVISGTTRYRENGETDEEGLLFEMVWSGKDLFCDDS